MTVLAYDTETTGTHHNAEIAQLGMILYAPDRRILGEFKSLIAPDGWTMPPETQEFHTKNGSTVSQANCEKYGISLRSALALFNNWCNKADVLVAFNQKYDLARIKYSADRLNITLNLPHKLHCAMEMATPIVKIPPTENMIKCGRGDQFKNPKLSEAVKSILGRDMVGAHDALADVREAAEVYFNVIDREVKKQ